VLFMLGGPQGRGYWGPMTVTDRSRRRTTLGCAVRVDDPLARQHVDLSQTRWKIASACSIVRPRKSSASRSPYHACASSHACASGTLRVSARHFGRDPGEAFMRVRELLHVPQHTRLGKDPVQADTTGIGFGVVHCGGACCSSDLRRAVRPEIPHCGDACFLSVRCRHRNAAEKCDSGLRSPTSRCIPNIRPCLQAN